MGIFLQSLWKTITANTTSLSTENDVGGTDKSLATDLLGQNKTKYTSCHSKLCCWPWPCVCPGRLGVASFHLSAKFQQEGTVHSGVQTVQPSLHIVASSATIPHRFPVCLARDALQDTNMHDPSATLSSRLWCDLEFLSLFFQTPPQL